jgi:hypothetical protein
MEVRYSFKIRLSCINLYGLLTIVKTSGEGLEIAPKFCLLINYDKIGPF